VTTHTIAVTLRGYQNFSFLWATNPSKTFVVVTKSSSPRKYGKKWYWLESEQTILCRLKSRRGPRTRRWLWEAWTKAEAMTVRSSGQGGNRGRNPLVMSHVSDDAPKKIVNLPNEIVSWNHSSMQVVIRILNQ